MSFLKSYFTNWPPWCNVDFLTIQYTYTFIKCNIMDVSIIQGTNMFWTWFSEGDGTNRNPSSCKILKMWLIIVTLVMIPIKSWGQKIRYFTMRSWSWNILLQKVLFCVVSNHIPTLTQREILILLMTTDSNSTLNLSHPDKNHFKLLPVMNLFLN